jgi:hypothetical protein
MVLMLWFYISGLVLLVGAEMNAEIEHASPYGKDEGEKVPGQKRKIGAARMRAWLQRKGARPPSAAEVKDAVGPTPPDKEPGRPLPEGAPAAARQPITAPAPARPAVPARPLAPAPAASYSRTPAYLIGAGMVLAPLWYAMRSLRRRA